MLVPLPGLESVERAVIPCNFPTRAPAASVEEVRTIALEPTLLTAPDNVLLLCEPYATTIISSRPIAASARVTLTELRPFKGISCVLIPTKENERVAFVATFVREFFPDSLVRPPLVVPLTNTVTPARGYPFGSVTVPFTASCWAEA